MSATANSTGMAFHNSNAAQFTQPRNDTSSSTEWWLISNSTYRVIGGLLEASLETLPNSQTKEDIRQALHHLDSGLHLTDAIPQDRLKQEDAITSNP